ncbi:MAG: ribonuclease III [Pseudomonadota bacterium]
MKLNPAQAAFEARLGYSFANKPLLVEALTHASLSVSTGRDNQRLEFLGDRVLGLTMAQALLDQDAAASEGDLAPRFNALVRKEACADVAASIDLGAALIMGRSEQATGGRRKLALLGDAMEAVIAAVYLDSDFQTARAMILRLWGTRLTKAQAQTRDPKTALQEWAQARGMPPPEYIEEGRSGPDHAPTFTIAAVLTTGAKATASAASKRAAQQAAAAALLEKLETGA